MRPLAVLRPEPGNAATVARATAAGFRTLSLPLFAVRGVDWAVEDAAAFDALIVTSANALRFGGVGLAHLVRLPVLAVGENSAAAARAAGFSVVASGTGDAAAIVTLAETRGYRRALHLAGRERTLRAGGVIAAVATVYESVAVPIETDRLQSLVGTCALLHSARAARRLGALIDAAGIARAALAIGAFSPAIAAAAGPGWAAIATAATPDDAALFDALRHP